MRKAIIPAAGFGTRHFPATKAVKKELFPVVGHDGRTRPAILAIVEEALAAGIEEIAVLVQPRDRDIFYEIFCCPPPIENFNKLSQADQQYCEYLMEVGRHITFLAQETQEGFGHAVYSAREWIGQEPFLLMLGDHLYTSNTHIGCARQLIETFEKVNRLRKSAISAVRRVTGANPAAPSISPPSWKSRTRSWHAKSSACPACRKITS